MQRSLEPMLILVIFFVFSASCFLAVLIGVGAYQRISGRMEANHTLRTCLSTIGGKVRGTNPGRVSIRELDGQDILVLQRTQNETTFNTYIYQQGGALYELDAEASRVFDPQDGDLILSSVRGFSMRLDGPLLVLTARDEKGRQVRLSILLPSGGGG